MLNLAIGCFELDCVFLAKPTVVMAHLALFHSMGPRATSFSSLSCGYFSYYNVHRYWNTLFRLRAAVLHQAGCRLTAISCFGALARGAAARLCLVLQGSSRRFALGGLAPQEIH